MNGLRRRILVVEDCAAAVRLLRESLRGFEDVDLDVAGDGDEARVSLRAATPPDLVLLDLNLPRGSGLEVLAELRADEATCACPVLVLTTSTSPSDVARAFELGANAYVLKPADFEQLQAAVAVIYRFWLRTVCLPAARTGGGAPG